MREIVVPIITCVLMMFLTPCRAEFNPFMGDYSNQVSVYISHGVNGGEIIPAPSQFVPFYFLHGQYSQPARFFRLPARQSLNVGQTLGLGRAYGWNWTKYTIPIAFISEDVALFYGTQWYTSAGAGAGLQAQQNERLGAKLLFQFKLAFGWHFTDRITGEAFVQHFSNANTAEQNNSYGFYGVGVAYNF